MNAFPDPKKLSRFFGDWEKLAMAIRLHHASERSHITAWV
jgi:hypothetical protein